MKTRRQALIHGASAVAALGLGHLPAFAQAIPETLRIVVGFPPGGTTDAFARRIGEKLRGVYATNIIVENRPGAGGQIGVSTLKAAAGDGATMLYTPASMLTVYPHSYSKLPYSQADVAPITIGHATDHAFVVGPAVPAEVTNLRQYVAWAKANPGKASVGNPGAGSMPHLLAGRLAQIADFQSLNVPFAGSGPGVPQVLGGQITSMSSPLGDWLQHHASGRIRILATSGPTRSIFVPNVPTYKEQGFDELVMRAPLGVQVTPTTQEQFAERLKADTEFSGRLVKALGFRADS